MAKVAVLSSSEWLARLAAMRSSALSPLRNVPHAVFCPLSLHPSLYLFLFRLVLSRCSLSVFLSLPPSYCLSDFVLYLRLSLLRSSPTISVSPCLLVIFSLVCYVLVY